MTTTYPRRPAHIESVKGAILLRRILALFALAPISVSVLTIPAAASPVVTTRDKVIGMDADLLGESLAAQETQMADMKANLHITTVAWT